MQHSDRSDAELIELSRRGWASAFAVLLHRHGADVHAVVQPDSDPLDAVIDTFVTAMRRLDRYEPSQAVRQWLLDIAASQVKDPRPAPSPGQAPPLPEEDLAEVWAALDERWPDGRRRRRPMPAPLRWAAVAMLLLIVAAGIPLTVFALMDGSDDVLENVRADPHGEDRTSDGATGDTDDLGTDAGPLDGLDDSESLDLERLDEIDDEG